MLLTSTISAEELFGVTNRLVTESGSAPVGDIASIGVLYQVLIALIATVYLGTVIHYADALLYIISSLVNKRVRRAENSTYISAIYNVERLMTMMGVVLISLCVVRLSIVPESYRLLSPLSALSPWAGFGVTFGALLLLIVGEVGIIYGVGLFVGKSSLWQELLQVKLLHFSATATLITPFIMLAMLTQGVMALVALGVVIVLCLISLIIFVKETFSLFISHKFSILHWILYLCALELFPLSLLVAPILRKGA